jgi:hypothetical protein
MRLSQQGARSERRNARSRRKKSDAEFRLAAGDLWRRRIASSEIDVATTL